MQTGVKGGETQEKEEPVLETWRGFRACSIFRTSDGGDGERAKGTNCVCSVKYVRLSGS